MSPFQLLAAFVLCTSPAGHSITWDIHWHWKLNSKLNWIINWMNSWLNSWIFQLTNQIMDLSIKELIHGYFNWQINWLVFQLHNKLLVIQLNNDLIEQSLERWVDWYLNWIIHWLIGRLAHPPLKNLLWPRRCKEIKLNYHDHHVTDDLYYYPTTSTLSATYC